MERRSPPPGDARDREEFERYCMAPGFRTLHHPESLVDQLVTQRAQALLAAPSVGRDIATGLLLPPPLSGQPVSSATKLVKLDHLPDAVVAHAYPVLLAAAGVVASGGAPPSKATSNTGGCSLSAMLFGEPVRADGMRCKAWALTLTLTLKALTLTLTLTVTVTLTLTNPHLALMVAGYSVHPPNDGDMSGLGLGLGLGLGSGSGLGLRSG